MILVDMNQVMISNLMAQIGSHHNVEVQEDLVRHMVLNSLRGYRNKFSSDYGELVICCDDKNYWRKRIFPYYKAHRKGDRENSKSPISSEELYNISPLLRICIVLMGKSQPSEIFPC